MEKLINLIARTIFIMTTILTGIAIVLIRDKEKIDKHCYSLHKMSATIQKNLDKNPSEIFRKIIRD